jgi:tripeptidyl-peptidase-2
MAFDIATDSPSWVSVPSNFMLMSNGRSFKIEVDPSQLPPGLHTANVFGRDATNQSRGPLFRLPITVVKPLQIQRVFDFGAIILQPAQVRRFFITPPAGSTWMDVTVKDTRPVTTSDGSSRLIVLHSVQILPRTLPGCVSLISNLVAVSFELPSLIPVRVVLEPDAAYRDFEKQRYISTLPSQTTVTSIAVEPEVTVEIDVARFWSTLGDTSLSVIVEFRGVRPVPSDLALTSGIGGTLVRLYSDLADETVCPTAKLTKWRTPLRPKAAGAVVRPILSDRDLSPSPNRRLYELILHYEFTQDDKGTFTPIAPALQGVLYEAAFECQLMLFFDGEKKYLGSSDAFPSAIKAPKGQVMIRLQARHDDPQKLEALKDLMIWIERGLEKEIVLSSYDSKEAMMSSDTFKKRLLRKGSIASVFIAHPGDSKVPSSCKPGDILHGTVTYESSEASLSGDGKRPGGFPVSLVVGPKPDKPPSDPEPKEPEDERTVDQKLSEAIRDLKILHLHKLSAKEKDEGHFDTLFNSLATEYPRHLPLLMTKLQHLDSKESKNLDKRSAEQLMQIIAAAESVISIIDQDSLSLHFGRKSDPDDPNAVKVS